MNTKNVSARLDQLKDLAAHLSGAAFLEAAGACGVFFVGDDRLAPEDEAGLMLEAMQGLSQSQIAKVAEAAEIVPEGTKVVFADKEPRVDGPKVNCEKPVTLTLNGPWIDQSKKDWPRKWLDSAIMIRNVLIGLAKAECANGECTGDGECSFQVEEGIEYGTETDSQDRTTRIRSVVTIKGKCVCPTRPTTGGSL